jgi:predicted PolB exonuclease-like 3'-5' exonuclease
MIFFDIETIPTDNQDLINKLVKDVKAPSNYKDEEKIISYIAEKKTEVIEKTALNGFYGRVLCVSFAIDDGDINTLYLDDFDDYREFLEHVYDNLTASKYIYDYDFRCKIKHEQLCGHGIQSFDLPFLSRQMVINGLKPLIEFNCKTWGIKAFDTMTAMQFGDNSYVSLENLCLAFGVKSPKGELDGSKVWQAYQDGKHDKIKAYCADDVRATREIYYKMVR